MPHADTRLNQPNNQAAIAAALRQDIALAQNSTQSGDIQLAIWISPKDLQADKPLRLFASAVQQPEYDGQRKRYTGKQFLGIDGIAYLQNNFGPVQSRKIMLDQTKIHDLIMKQADPYVQKRLATFFHDLAEQSHQLALQRQHGQQKTAQRKAGIGR